MTDFRYEPHSHTYWLGDRRLPSVTAIMRRAGLGQPPAGIDPAILERARIRGVRVHAVCEAIDRDDLAEIPDELAGRIAAYLRFRRETRIEVIRTEEPTYHRTLLYAGTPDVECWLNSEHVIIERKAVAVLSDDTAAQLAAQAAMRTSHGEQIDAVFALQLKPNGRYNLQPFNLDQGWGKFSRALQMWPHARVV